MTKEQVIQKLKDDINDYENPMSYQDTTYYVKCKIKASYAREILELLERE